MHSTVCVYTGCDFDKERREPVLAASGDVRMLPNSWVEDARMEDAMVESRARTIRSRSFTSCRGGKGVGKGGGGWMGGLAGVKVPACLNSRSRVDQSIPAPASGAAGMTGCTRR